MKCPACLKPLPFYFAFSSGLRKLTCPACKKTILPTRESLDKIKLISVILSFVAGVPLGVICSYLWINNLQFGLAVFVFITGIIGVMGSAFIYSKSHIKFQLDKGSS